MSYIGSTPTSQNFISGTDYFNGTGSQTAFTLTRTVNSVNDIEAVVNNVVQRPNDAYTLSGTTLTFTSAPSSGTSNIYVRYLSTTMQSFTVPANSITRNQLDSNLQSVAVGRNRIINGAMTIDQRNAGASVTQTTSAPYTLDRWYAFGSVTSKFTVQQDAGAVTPPVGFTDYLGATSSSAYTVGSSEQYNIAQVIEGYNIADLGWGTANAKTVTLSFWVYSSLTGTFGGSLRNVGTAYSYPYTYTISAANTWEYKTVTIAGPTVGTWGSTNGVGIYVNFSMGAGSTLSGTAGSWSANNYTSATGATSVVGTNGATFFITGVQLEKGTQATSFEYRQYGTELALCQRYFVKVGGTAASESISIGLVDASTQVSCITYFPVSMRAAPTIGFNSASGFFVNDAASQSATSAISINSPGLLTTGITVTSSGLTTGRAARLFTASTANFISYSAEI